MQCGHTALPAPSGLVIGGAGVGVRVWAGARVCSALVISCRVSGGSPLWNCGDLAVPEEKEATHEKLMLLVGKSAVPDVRSPGLCLHVEMVRKCLNLVKQDDAAEKGPLPPSQKIEVS